MTDTALYADLVLPATTFLEVARRAEGLRTGQPAARQARHRAGGRGAAQRRCVRRRGTARRPGTEGEPADDLETLLAVAAGLPAAASAALWDAGIAVPDSGQNPVQFGRRAPARRPTARSTCFRTRSTGRRPADSTSTRRTRPPSGSRSRSSPPRATARSVRRSGSSRVPRSRSRCTPTMPTRREIRRRRHGARLQRAGRGAVRDLRSSRRSGRGPCRCPRGSGGRHTANESTANALAPDTLTDFAGGRVLQRRTRGGGAGVGLSGARLGAAARSDTPTIIRSCCRRPALRPVPPIGRGSRRPDGHGRRG